MESMEKPVGEVHPKSFSDLVTEVHERGICGRCGGCVSFCSASKMGAIEMTPDGPPRYANEEACLKCGICYLICPQVPVLTGELNAKFGYKDPIGVVDNIYSARATDPEIRARATDGGVVTALLAAMLEDKLIDGALVCKSSLPFQRVPFLARTKEELLDAAGTHFDMAGQVTELGNYSTFIPVITELHRMLNEDLQKIAVVAVPCQVHSIRKMQELKIIPAHIVKYVLGLFCWENFDFGEEGRVKLERAHGFEFSKITKMNIKEDLVLEFGDDSSIHLDFGNLKEVVRPACSACNDFSNYYADISFGGVGSPPGYTTVMVRTNIGRDLYNLAARKKFIEESAELNTAVDKSKMMASVVGFSKRKQDRAREFFRS
ncbi:MAG: Coenzyme F420 hydrogenase/dehydrogenase, beta subunit C-terminal domain [Promethearchaeota archaeon]